MLCVADGEGRNSVWLAKQGFTVEATEISAVAVDKARSLAKRSGVEVAYRVADILCWDPPVAAYDAVVAVFIQFATKGEQLLLFRQLKEALRPGGVLLLIGYTPKQLEYRTGGPPCVEQLYDAELLLGHFGDLEMVRLDVFEDFLEEGKAHRGQSALIGMVARKAGR